MYMKILIWAIMKTVLRNSELMYIPGVEDVDIGGVMIVSNLIAVHQSL